ncbi:MAG: linear amide C-N hydrolase [Ignavibacteria bacterium]|nr:linear amide C-N hydrolase [Ignavibacteria bacterium]MBT8381892.1 linear amide C-N hydrolase [Ignavibacteria bacterium]MBT8391070.1 linear amide C-N hydrolase [Ignavibacteria bacterium]NNJ54455.1 linear amide C-N hydrolase [Ignavibacteriaceae bacterium]NNL21856.1 linear amide C-N hydrolase [Ignavibacteriaceae bacterium]
MQRSNLFLVLPIILCYFVFSSCNEETNPISSGKQTYETSYGTATQVDNYPLFALDYSADYNFEEYLQTGIIPGYVPSKSANKDFSCTCFSAFGEDSRLLARNYDWDTPSSYFIILTDPPNSYSSISTVDLSFFNYDHEKSPASPENQNTIRTLPYFPFDGMNEKGVAIGMNAVPYAQSPYDASKITIGELQLIRLVLDYASSTQQAINLIQQYNINMENPPIHYLIADSSGSLCNYRICEW